jgi:nucleoid DNA-binding protein
MDTGCMVDVHTCAREVSTMTKAEIVAEMASATKVSKTLAARGFMAAIDCITQAMKKEERVTIVGFGTFFVVRRKARTFKNPRTDKEMKIAAKKVPRFSAGAALMAAINGQKDINVR